MLKVKLLSHTPNPEEVIASAAKLCYSPVGVDEIMKKLNKENTKEFIKKLSQINHLSPFEHASFTFAVEGVSRTLTHQLVRHRIASYSQQSQRYVKEDNFEYIVPPSIQNNEKAKKMFINQMKVLQEIYDDIVRELLLDKIFNSPNYETWYAELAEIKNLSGCDIKELYKEILIENDRDKMDEYILLFKDMYKQEFNSMEKASIEDARYIFPNATETKIVVTMNVRSLMNFFTLRCCNRAQWEIRQLADKMFAEVYEIAPDIFHNSGAPCTFGKCDQGAMSCGKPRKLQDIIGE